jgi:uncharacterized membrane protein YraQ (UPF0718 family)
MTPGSNAPQMSGVWMLVMRASLGFVVSVVTGLIVERMNRKYSTRQLTGMLDGVPEVDDETPDEISQVSIWKHISNVSETALHDFVEITVFLIIGALIAAFFKVLIDPQTIGEWSEGRPYLAIAIMMAFAVVVTLCSEADAFVAANFVTMRPAAKLAFLVLGPMLDFKLIFMYTRIFKPRLMYTIIAAVVIQVFLYSYVTHVLWENYAPPIPATAPVLPTQPRSE